MARAVSSPSDTATPINQDVLNAALAKLSTANLTPNSGSELITYSRLRPRALQSLSQYSGCGLPGLPIKSSPSSSMALGSHIRRTSECGQL